MGGNKKRGSKVTVDRGAGNARQTQPDLSKYRNASSNKSRINYADLKLVRSEKSKPEEENTDHSKKKSPAPSREKKDKTAKKAAKNTIKKTEKKDKKQKKTAVKQREKSAKAAETAKKTSKAESQPILTAEERFSNSLEKNDHYSSAVEKYYMKYPDKKRPERTTASRRAAEPQKKKRKPASGGEAKGQTRRSMAEIAVRNKGTSSVRKHARAARSAKARGVISPRVANRSFYRRKKRRSGALNVLMVTLLLVFLSAVGVTVFLNVKQVNVSGENPYGDARIKSVCNIKKGGNVLFINTGELEKKVERELPYIAQCKIKIKLPSTVVINVTRSDVLGVAQNVMGQWSVISTEGKILESSKDKVAPAAVGADADAEGTTYTPDTGSASELAELRKLPVLTGLEVRGNVKDGFIADDEVLEHIDNFVQIRDAFEKMKMRLTAINYGSGGYEAEYDGRILIVFGKETERNTLLNRVREVHSLIFDEGFIAENDMGEVRFVNNQTHFRRSYEVSEEEVEYIHEQRREANRDRLMNLAEIFISTGADWYKGKLKNE